MRAYRRIRRTAPVLCMILLLCVTVCSATVYAAVSYALPIVSLTTKAPIPAVKTAFSKAFGDTALVETQPDGKTYMTLENRHMTIRVFGKTYEANVMTVGGAQSVGTKQEPFSEPQGGILSDPVIRTQTVPAAFRMPMQLDADGAQVLTITVDFMDAFMGKGDAHPMHVTLTVDTSVDRPAEASTTQAETTALPEESAPQEGTQPETEQTASAAETQTERESAAASETARVSQTQADAQPSTPAKGRTAGIAIVVLAVCAALLILVAVRVQKNKGMAKT